MRPVSLRVQPNKGQSVAKSECESVDLCYIDPSFNSKGNYFQIYNNQGDAVKNTAPLGDGDKQASLL
jgi:hypothetical protein